MGPISLDWFRQRGLTVEEKRWSDFFQKDITVTNITQNWMGGRIDVYGTDNPYGEEIALPIMHGCDWANFSDWLDNYETETVQTLDKILESYYNSGNDKIRWWKDDK